MKEFQTSKNGYNKDEVTNYFEEMEEKLQSKDQEIAMLNKKLSSYIEKENDYIEKEKNISVALTAAVEKAKQIETSSYNVYKLKIEELEILYARWEKVLNELVVKYPDLDEIDNVKKLRDEFSSSIKNSLKEDFRFTNNDYNVKRIDPLRELLKKMGSSLNIQLEQNGEIRSIKRPRKPITLDMKNKQSELVRLEEKSSMIKPFYNSKMGSTNDYNSPVDKFLTERADTNSAYASKLTASVGAINSSNEDGFDLKEAINPKQDLDEIMKSFDFYNG